MAKVAVIQVESSCDATEALLSSVRLIGRAAAEHSAQIVVFPQLPVDDEDDLSTEGSFASSLRESSTQHQVWLLGSVLHRGLVSSVWVEPGGAFSTRQSSDLEQTGSGGFVAEAAIISTPHGKIGLSVGPLCLRAKVARALSLAGADLVCMSLSLREEVELSLHLPARAVENQRFVAVAALLDVSPGLYPTSAVTLPPELSVALDVVEEAPRASVSQIVAPAGHQVACGDLGAAELDLLAPDSVDSQTLRELVTRRPDVYRGFPLRTRSREQAVGSLELDVAALGFTELGSVRDAIAWAREHVEELAAKEVGLVVLPELFCFDPDLTAHHGEAAADFLTVVQSLALACRRTNTHVVTSLVEQVGEAFFHVGVVIGQQGIVLRQAQLHLTEQHTWATPGRTLSTARMPWGKLGLVVGEDALVPEVLEGLGRADVEVLAAPLSQRLASISHLTLSAAADEAGYAVVAATRPQCSNEGLLASSSFVVDPQRWPVQRALETQEVLRATLRLEGIREARAAEPSALRARRRAPELALG